VLHQALVAPLPLSSDSLQRASSLVDQINGKAADLANAPLGDDYNATRANIADFREYRRTQRREWVGEQADLTALFNNIQAKRKANNLPAFAAPEGLELAAIEQALDSLAAVEKERRTNLNANLRAQLEALRRDFADKANAFYEKLLEFRSKLADTSEDLDTALSTVKGNLQELKASQSDLPEIEASEARCIAANIEENEHTDQTADDLSFEFDQLQKAYQKQVTFLETQIASQSNTGVSAEQIEEFKETYSTFTIGGRMKRRVRGIPGEER
jgi:cofilin